MSDETICEECGYALHQYCECLGEREVAALERIATALEALVTKTPPPVLKFPPSGGTSPQPTSFFQCPRCLQWIQSGSVHNCYPTTTTWSRGYADAAGPNIPTVTINPNRCDYHTAAAMQCSLLPGHAGAHKII